MGDVDVQKLDPAGTWRILPIQQVEECRLAGTIRPDDQMFLVTGEGNVDPANDVDGAKGFLEPLDGDRRLRADAHGSTALATGILLRAVTCRRANLMPPNPNSATMI